MTSEVSSLLSEGIIELSPRNMEFFTYFLLIPKKNGESHFIMNLKAAELAHYLCKVQDDHSETDKRGHSSSTMGSLTQHQVSILPHSNSKETSLPTSLQVERQNLSVQGLALQSIHCSQDLYGGHEAPSCTYV